jgi:hypothetical protein
MNPAAQIELPLKVKRPELPTVDLAGARGISGISENVLKVMIEAREIPWAWDIASQTSERLERRILTACAFDAREGEKRDLTLDQVVRILYGREQPFITGKHFYRAWNCDEGLFFKLVEEGSIQVATKWRRGPGGSPKMTWAAAVRFAEQRRIP